jgi:hypothetical protein
MGVVKCSCSNLHVALYSKECHFIHAKLKELTIAAAIKLICGDMVRVPLAGKQYPSVDDMTSTESQLALIPDSLRQLLEPIVKSDEKVVVWGQNLLKAYRPRSVVMPFHLGMTIQLDHKFGSKWLIERCHHLGYCESYTELHHYKYCYLSANHGHISMDQETNITTEDEADDVGMQEDDADTALSADDQGESGDERMDEDHQTATHFDQEESTVHQFVGDNIDLNIVSLNGNTSFYAMGMVKATCPAPQARPDQVAVIPRKKITFKEKAGILKATEVKMLSYVPKKKVGLADVRFVPIEDLSQNPPTLLPGDIAWAAGWVIKNHNNAFEHSNWNGFMKSIRQTGCKEKSFIEFLPIVEGVPNDYSTI